MPNDYVLYKDEFATLRVCPICGLSQYKKKNLMEIVVRKK